MIKTLLRARTLDPIQPVSSTFAADSVDLAGHRSGVAHSSQPPPWRQKPNPIVTRYPCTSPGT